MEIPVLLFFYFLPAKNRKLDFIHKKNPGLLCIFYRTLSFFTPVILMPRFFL